jgi:hypothetical protein
VFEIKIESLIYLSFFVIYGLLIIYERGFVCIALLGVPIIQYIIDEDWVQSAWADSEQIYESQIIKVESQLITA